jgi:3-deoxy-7-phosphoheptulonate synthase
MVEVHPKPEEAWSDGEQSLTIPMFQRLAGELRSIHTLVKPLNDDPGAAGASPSKK